MTTLQKLIKVSKQIANLQVEFARLKSEAGEEYVSTYTVRATKIKAHTRRGHTVRRIRNTKTK